MTVRRDLHAVYKARRKIVNEFHRGVAVARPNMPARNELAVGIRRNPKPSVASLACGLLCGSDVLLLGGDETPNFINLKPLALEALKDAILIPSRRLAGIHNELTNGCLAHAG